MLVAGVSAFPVAVLASGGANPASQIEEVIAQAENNLREGDWAAAETRYQDALQQGRLLLALLELQAGNAERAAQLLEEARAAAPQDLEVAFVLGNENQKDGTFKEVGFPMGVAVSEDSGEQGSMGVAIGDYNHSGRLSLYVTNYAEEYNALYRNEGSHFTDVSFRSKTAPASLLTSAGATRSSTTTTTAGRTSSP